MRHVLPILAILAVASTAHAVTGTVTATPYHQVIPEGQTRSSTISWSTSGASNAQLYVSQDGGAEILYGTGVSGSKPSPILTSPGTWVFTLYDGTGHTTRLAWTSVTTQRSTSQFGFNYWPAGYGADVLNAGNWPGQRPIVAADLDHMASLSGNVIRLFLWPQNTGFQLAIPMGGGFFTSDLAASATNLVDLLHMCADRNIKVIIVFANNFYDQFTNGHPWWMEAYATSNFAAFLNDSHIWAATFITAIEGSAYKNTVLFYDLENEWTNTYPNASWYITFANDWFGVPRGKRGVSVLRVPTDSDDLKLQFDADAGPELGTRRLDYIDFHSYPVHQPIANANIEQCYDQIHARWPQTTVLMGEFGRAGTTQPGTYNETLQEVTVLDLINRSITKGISYYLNWTLWDRFASQPDTGFGYAPNQPKDVLGAVSARLNLIKNPDMEILHTPCSTWACSYPQYWQAAGTGPLTFFSGGPQASDAATHLWFARLSMAYVAGRSGWMASDSFTVTGGKRLFVNGYIRASFKNVRMNIVEYNASSVWLQADAGPSYSPPSWGWDDYLQKVGSWSVVLRPDTRFVIVTVSGEVSASPSNLDIDGLSAYQLL